MKITGLTDERFSSDADDSSVITPLLYMSRMAVWVQLPRSGYVAKGRLEYLSSTFINASSENL